ncbi:hypothetical protein ADK41_28195 [Streptomyces caelestis]|uniref:Uncharacterized protein n=1 Tax=Streptomyces caelestis TaxID=36816 RepID=A0A0M8QHY3_9ACTN|nr:hypothetical protein ADK41_28195 [Streptomyces caelestis]KOV36158.1 hypothetical protein ADK58_01610 [Streptomyces sp. XY152]
MGQAPAADRTAGAVDAPSGPRAVVCPFATAVCAVGTHRGERGRRPGAVTAGSPAPVPLELSRA